jgi:hypothetical protein
MDYYFSEKFGLDWKKKMDSQRAYAFIEIYSSTNKKEKIELDKLKNSNGRRR